MLSAAILAAAAGPALSIAAMRASMLSRNEGADLHDVDIKTSGNGNWSSTGTWDLGRIPTTGDIVAIDHAVTYDVSSTAALEAVCLKAMALKPEDRYAAPKALAEDVERWLADEPVTA